MIFYIPAYIINYINYIKEKKRPARPHKSKVFKIFERVQTQKNGGFGVCKRKNRHIWACANAKLYTCLTLKKDRFVQFFEDFFTIVFGRFSSRFFAAEIALFEKSLLM